MATTTFNVPVFTIDLAKYLLKAGYQIVDISPNYHTGNKYESVFFFKKENGIQETIDKYIKTRYKKR